MASLDVAAAITNVKTMLSNLTAWQTICGVATAAEAAGSIYEGGIEVNEDEEITPCIILDVTGLPTNWVASHLRGELTIEMRVELAVPEWNQRTYSTQYLWVWAQWSALMDGINGAVGSSGQLMISKLETPIMPGRVDDNTNSGRCEWGFIFNLVLEFI